MKALRVSLLTLLLAHPLHAADLPGRQLFLASCASCHGNEARGDEGPDLHHLTLSDIRMATTIKAGVKGEMPSFARQYDDAQIAALVAYLRSLD